VSQGFRGTTPITLVSLNYTGTGSLYPVMYNSGTANTFGEWVQLGTLPPYKTNRLALNGRIGNATAYLPGLINIGIGPSPSQTILVPNLVCDASGGSSGPTNYTLPIKLPPNLAIWAQYAQNTTTSEQSYEIGGYVYNEPEGMETDLIVPFVDASNSSGIIITLYGNSGSWGPVTLVSSTPQNFRGYFFSIFPVGGASDQYFSTEILVNGTVVFPSFVTLNSASAGTIMTSAQYGPFSCVIPAGSSVTCQGYYYQGTIGNSIQVGFYGLV